MKNGNVDDFFDPQISGYQIDSREVFPGNLFFAVSGEKVDGHEFLSEVANKGAFGAIVSQRYRGPDFGLKLFFVESVEETLGEMAKRSLELAPVPVIGVTGSVGKTTTKDFIATLLGGKFRVGKTEKSRNTKLTLPLTVLNRDPKIDVLVLEMGMSEPGGIKRHVTIAPPTIAVVTKVALVHAENFSSGIEAIAEEKKEIFSQPNTKHRISNLSSDHTSFSLSDVAHFKDLPFIEEHFLYNLAAAVCVAKKMGLTDQEIALQVPKLSLPKMRFERVEKKGVLFINDAYNAGPESMKAALTSIEKMRVKGKKIAILGSMKELGVFCETSHKEIGEFASKKVDLLFALDTKVLYDAFASSQKKGEHFICKQELLKRLKVVVNEGDLVLVKGSRVHKLETIIECF